MIRRIALLSISALMLSFWGVSQAAFGQEAGTNITGDWAVQMTGNQFLSGGLHLSQVGTTVVGSAMSSSSGGSGVLQLSGKLEGDKFSGEWRDPKGDTGWVTFNFTPGHNAFNGDWGYGGRKPNGHIVARKVRTTAF